MVALRNLIVPKINAGGATFNYELTGAGETLVLLHEIGGTLQSWSAVAPDLAKRFHVLAYDQRGCGSSDRIVGDFSLDTHIADLRTLLAALGLRGRLHLAGVAIGTALAVRYAASFPRDIGSLVLACPALSVSEERKTYLAERAALVAAEGMAATVEQTLGLSYPPEAMPDRAAYDAYRSRFLANDPKSYAAINTAFARFDATPDLAAIRAPTLVLAGTHDRLRPPAQTRQIAERIAGMHYNEIDAGHLMPVQAPSAMAAAMLSFYEPIVSSHNG
jgi:3-oxoadipate enol-lactonase